MLWIHRVIVLGIILNLSNAQSNSDDENVDFESFKPFGGPTFKSLYSNPNLDVSESTYLEEDNGQNRRYFQIVDPQPRFTQSFLYVSPDDVEEKLTRHKRNPEEPEDYDYTKSYREFVKENFDFTGDEAKPLSTVDYDQDDNDREYENIKALSNKQSEESKKHPEYCKHVRKDGKDCMICKNPKTNAKSESCSYSSAPPAKKYAYKRERNYKSKDDEDEEGDHEEEATEKKESKIPRNSKQKATKQNNQSNKSPARRGSRYVPPENYKSTKPQTYSKQETSQDYDDESAKSSNRPQDFYAAGNSHSVDKVLEEFKAKDWSKCQRKSKNGLTCYYCKDPNGVSQEECMYLSEQGSPHNRMDSHIKDSSRVENARQTKRQRTITPDRRSRNVEDTLNPDDYQEVPPIEKHTIKRMVSFKIQDTNPELPTGEKSLFYAKKITQTTK